MARERRVRVNADIDGWDLDALAPLRPDARRLLERMVRSGRLTARGMHRIRRVSRTVADLMGHVGAVDEVHVASALALRVPVAGTDAAVAS